MALGKRNPEPGELTGSARIGAHAKDLASELKRGEIAVIDHPDLDRMSAAALVEANPTAVLNAARSTTGRYPNLGPGLLVEAGIPLIDDLGVDVLAIRDGRTIRIDGGDVYVGKELVAEGTRQTRETVDDALAEAREGLPLQLSAFAAGTVAHLDTESEFLLDGVGVPVVNTPVAGREVVVVTKSEGAEAELGLLKKYIKERKPLLIGVDGGADLLLAAKLTPGLIVGDMSALSDAALNCGAELVAHGPRGEDIPGLARVEELRVEFARLQSGGTAEDAALVLAHAKDAALVVTVGSHTSLAEFLDRGRAGMSSSFLTRLALGSTIVDAPTVARLHRPHIATWQLVMLFVAAFIALGVALYSTEVGQALTQLLGNQIQGDGVG